MKITRKIISLALSLGLVLGMGTAAFADPQPELTNLLPYPDAQEFNKLINYSPNYASNVTLKVQGADQNYRPFAMTQTEAAGVTFTAHDGLSAGATTTSSQTGAGYCAQSDITVPAGASYGPKFVEATLSSYTPNSWTGKIDLGVILNSRKNISAQDVKVYYFNGAPGPNNRLKKATNLSVTQGLVKSPIKYASALDAAKAGNDNITLRNPRTINVYAYAMRINGTTYTASGNIGWQYKVYNSNGNKMPNCEKAGAEVFPVENGIHVVWAYGNFGILPDHIDPNLFN